VRKCPSGLLIAQVEERSNHPFPHIFAYPLSLSLPLSTLSLSLYLSIYLIHTHTHTQRERERERERLTPCHLRHGIRENTGIYSHHLEPTRSRPMARYTSKAMKEGAAVMRGPMASNTMHQLIAFTDWGYLDYLIIDMPPGTSDIHLTLGQEVTMDGMFLPRTIHLSCRQLFNSGFSSRCT
jgi:hypothetical protein